MPEVRCPRREGSQPGDSALEERSQEGLLRAVHGLVEAAMQTWAKNGALVCVVGSGCGLKCPGRRRAWDLQIASARARPNANAKCERVTCKQAAQACQRRVHRSVHLMLHKAEREADGDVRKLRRAFRHRVRTWASRLAAGKEHVSP